MERLVLIALPCLLSLMTSGNTAGIGGAGGGMLGAGDEARPFSESGEAERPGQGCIEMVHHPKVD